MGSKDEGGSDSWNQSFTSFTITTPIPLAHSLQCLITGVRRTYYTLQRCRCWRLLWEPIRSIMLRHYIGWRCQALLKEMGTHVKGWGFRKYARCVRVVGDEGGAGLKGRLFVEEVIRWNQCYGTEAEVSPQQSQGSLRTHGFTRTYICTHVYTHMYRHIHRKKSSHLL